MNKQQRGQLVKALILLTFLSFFVMGLGLYDAYDAGVKAECKTSDFKCNPYYFGTAWGYSNTCPNSYINVTGNYCNGILVCENE